jgi:hypothetical protein
MACLEAMVVLKKMENYVVRMFSLWSTIMQLPTAILHIIHFTLSTYLSA